METIENKRKANLFDTHAHLAFEPLKKNIDDVLERARNHGVSRIVTIGAGDGVDGNAEALEIARVHDNLWATVGIHPHDARLADEKVLENLMKMAEDPKVVAWGEIGLDFHYDNSPRDVQRKMFLRQLEIATGMKMPVVIHDREAHEETLKTLRRFFPAGHSGKPVGIMHCFSGDAELARVMTDMGFLISIPGVVTFKNAKTLVNVVKEIPIEKLLIETDCPFLTPEPYRGKKNEPAHVRFVAEKIAGIKGLAFEDVARVTTANALDLYGLEQSPRKAAIAYTIRGNLYLNITNKCNNKCTFCMKHTTGSVKAHYLLLDREPTVDEIIEAIGDPTKYPEVVFVGLGEPTLRLDIIKKVARWLKEKGVRVRLDTDGQANMVHGHDVTSELKGLIDAVSVSLNAGDPKTYVKLCRPARGREAYYAVLDFLRDAKKNIAEVTATVVGLPGLDIDAARKVAEDIGVNFRVRVYNDPGAP